MAGGVLLAASSAKRDREAQRDLFRQKLGASLLGRGWELVSATVGRDKQNAPVWLVSVRGTEGVSSLQVRLPKAMKPYDEQAVSTILAQLA
jgi:hypothetical protein